MTAVTMGEGGSSVDLETRVEWTARIDEADGTLRCTIVGRDEYKRKLFKEMMENFMRESTEAAVGLWVELVRRHLHHLGFTSPLPAHRVPGGGGSLVSHPSSSSERDEAEDDEAGDESDEHGEPTTATAMTKKTFGTGGRSATVVVREEEEEESDDDDDDNARFVDAGEAMLLGEVRFGQRHTTRAAAHAHAHGLIGGGGVGAAARGQYGGGGGGAASGGQGPRAGGEQHGAPALQGPHPRRRYLLPTIASPHTRTAHTHRTHTHRTRTRGRFAANASGGDGRQCGVVALAAVAPPAPGGPRARPGVGGGCGAIGRCFARAFAGRHQRRPSAHARRARTGRQRQYVVPPPHTSHTPHTAHCTHTAHRTR